MPFTKGNKLGKGMPLGHKTGKVIKREKAREYFEATQMLFWDKISMAQAKQALRDRQTREFTINQVIGKPKESIEVKGVKKLLIDM